MNALHSMPLVRANPNERVCASDSCTTASDVVFQASNRRQFLQLGLAVSAASMQWGCTSSSPTISVGTEVLLNANRGLENWSSIGNANWRFVDGILRADAGTGFLISNKRYANFQLRVEFFADDDANSGVFLRLQNDKEITTRNSYEVNIFDKRPGQEYSTGAIVDIAKVALPAPKVGGKWSVYDIVANGGRLIVNLNGVKTSDIQDTKFASGPIALQYASGVVKDKGVIQFRKVEIKPL